PSYGAGPGRAAGVLAGPRLAGRPAPLYPAVALGGRCRPGAPFRLSAGAYARHGHGDCGRPGVRHGAWCGIRPACCRASPLRPRPLDDDPRPAGLSGLRAGADPRSVARLRHGLESGDDDDHHLFPRRIRLCGWSAPYRRGDPRCGRPDQGHELAGASLYSRPARASGAHLGPARCRPAGAARCDHRRMGRCIGGAGVRHGAGQCPHADGCRLRRHGHSCPSHPPAAVPGRAVDRRMGALGNGERNPPPIPSLPENKPMTFRLLPMLAAFGFLAAAAPTQAANRLTVLLEWFVNPDHAPMVIAKQRGLFEQAGLDVELLPPADPSAVPRLVSARQADIGVHYQPNLYLDHAAGLPLVRFGTLVETPLNTVTVLADGPIKSLADLKGKKVGFSVSGFEDAMLKRMLAEKGL